MKKIIILACVLLLTGCAFNPQTVNLNPKLSISGNLVKGLNTLAIQVIDDRPTKSLGQRMSNYGPGGEITAEQELVDVIKIKMIEGFDKRGFRTLGGILTKSTTIIAEIRALEYTTSMGFWTVGAHANGAIKIIAEHEGENFKKMYRVKNEVRSLGTTAQGNEEVINAALSDLLSKIISDEELFDFLTAD